MTSQTKVEIASFEDPFFHNFVKITLKFEKIQKDYARFNGLGSIPKNHKVKYFRKDVKIE